MRVDLFLLALTLLPTIVAIVLGDLLYGARREMNLLRDHCQTAVKNNWRLRAENDELKRLEQGRAAIRKLIASQGGKALAAKRAKIEAAEGPARRAKTTAALAHTAFRPRDEVVADVAANRAARKNSPAGVAAQS